MIQKGPHCLEWRHALYKWHILQKTFYHKRYTTNDEKLAIINTFNQCGSRNEPVILLDYIACLAGTIRSEGCSRSFHFGNMKFENEEEALAYIRTKSK